MISAPIWYTQLNQPLPGCTAGQWEWLVSQDSLTARLRRLSDDATRIELQSAGWRNVYPEEQTILHPLPGPFWVREIIHAHGQTAWVWGRVVIPKQTLAKTGLDASCSQSIGDILFHDPDLKRSELAVSRLPIDHPYFQSAKPYLQNSQDSPWARRSIIWFHQQPLLVVEMFLPSLFRNLL